MKLCLAKLEQAGLPSNQPFEQLAPFLAGFDDKISQMRAEQEATSRSIQQDQKRAATLVETGEGKCPVCSQPLLGNYKTDLLSSIKQENGEREKTINHLRLEVATLQKTKTVASEAYTNLQNCLTRGADLKSRIAEEETTSKPSPPNSKSSSGWRSSSTANSKRWYLKSANSTYPNSKQPKTKKTKPSNNTTL